MLFGLDLSFRAYWRDIFSHLRDKDGSLASVYNLFIAEVRKEPSTLKRLIFYGLQFFLVRICSTLHNEFIVQFRSDMRTIYSGH